MLKFLTKNKNTIALLAILILAAYLRLYRISDYMTFLGDEGRDLLEVRKILSGNLVFLGPRSSAADFYYGPVYFYLITPFLLLFRYDPVGPAVFIALVGIATVYLVYFIGKKYLHERAGLFAAALYAVSPLVIAYSRSSWNPNPLPFVSLAALYSAYLSVKTGKLRFYFLTGILMGVAIQLQYLALFLGAVLFLFLALGIWLEKKKTVITEYIRAYGIVFLGFITGWSPFLAFELKHSFPNLRTLVNFLFIGNTEKVYVQNTGFTENIQSVFFKLFARLLTRFPPPEQVNISEDPMLQLWQIATIILGVTAVFLLFTVKDKLAKLQLFLWLTVGIFLFGFYKKDIYDYYLGFLYPLPFLLTGNALNYISAYRKHKLVSLLSALLIFCVLFFWNLKGNPFQYVPNRQKDQVRMIAEFVLAKTDNKPYNFALLTKGNSDHAYRYYFEINNRQPVDIKNEVIDPERKTVTDQLLIICEDPGCQPLGNGLWEVAGFGRAEIAGEWQVSVVKVYRLIHYRNTP